MRQDVTAAPAMKMSKINSNMVETNYFLEGPDNGQNQLTNIGDMDQSDNPDVIFVLNLDIGSGKKDKIIFRSTDSPEDLALKFCRKNNLNIRVYDFVANALREKYDEVTLMKYIQKVNDEDDGRLKLVKMDSGNDNISPSQAETIIQPALTSN